MPAGHGTRQMNLPLYHWNQKHGGGSGFPRYPPCSGKEDFYNHSLQLFMLFIYTKTCSNTENNIEKKIKFIFYTSLLRVTGVCWKLPKLPREQRQGDTLYKLVADCMAALNNYLHSHLHLFTILESPVDLIRMFFEKPTESPCKQG